ncbi:FecCD family ABC transporter permease [Microbacterium murale]|uniref:Iron complex transport system permease protein n=1 Tax=Microbacterium murale TaxID=1081040 RepID=A0ABU0PBB5_9MICO|nr:iron chelate uptake ABC transporter family permease subunit [Microbacterium murale]MDQ0643884.1 iron complex transport system permease protein [Microbacterium murale]
MTSATSTCATRRGTTSAIVFFVVGIIVLTGLCVASLVIGSASIPLGELWQVVTDPTDPIAEATLLGLRVPRTILGVLVGAALGVSGALMQALTRNPLADPGILGVNAGAGFAVVLGVAFLGITRIDQYLPLAFLGALLAAVLVYVLAALGERPPSPLRMTLVGVATSAVLIGFSQTLALIDVETFDRMRFWGAGTLADRPGGTIETVAPWIIAGLALAVVSSRALNAVALGDDVARSFGARVGAVRITVALSITLLCGAATAAVGPIGFIGLMVPHLIRPFTGPDQRRIIAFSAIVAPVLLLGSDILGRVMVDSELQVGIVTALVGAPILALLARNTRAVNL